MVMKNNGMSRQSKKSKKSHKSKQVKCSCGEMNSYDENSVENLSGMRIIICEFCGREITLK